MIERWIASIVVIALLILCGNISTSAEEVYGKVHCRNARCQGKIALTFDDGPHPRFTKQILSILEEYHVTATFFIIGVNAENYPEDLRRIVDFGCEIGNHTQSHRRLKNLSEEEIKLEITQCEDMIERICGITPRVFRPPEGMMNDNLKRISAELGYDLILWSIDTKDWALTPAEEIQQRVKYQMRGGDIILMHDYIGYHSKTPEALEIIIPKLLSQGYEFVTVSALLGIQ